jgi:hypothetical protein
VNKKLIKKNKLRCVVLICLVIWNVSLIYSFTSVEAEETYELTLTEGTSLIYEYTKVDEDLLEELADSTGVEEYEDLAELDEGDQVKMIITTIAEEEDRWIITVELYRGKNFEERAEDLEVNVYKDPSDLKDEILEEEDDDQLSFYFFPVNVKTYLESFEESVIDDERYLKVDYELFVDDTGLTFDYTPLGYSDTIEQTYTEDGILEEFKILCYGEDAFKRELVDISQETINILSITILSVISISAISTIIVIYILRKKQYFASDPEKVVDKLLNEVSKI